MVNTFSGGGGGTSAGSAGSSTAGSSTAGAVVGSGVFCAHPAKAGMVSARMTNTVKNFQVLLFISRSSL